MPAKLEFPMQLDKIYEPQRFEPHWAKCWVETGIFHADAEAPGPYFSLVTGSLLPYSSLQVPLLYSK
jgi:hypothetical protein